MARLPRLYAPAVVQYLVQRPIAGRRLFDEADDYVLFIDLLGEAVRGHGVALHAFVLLPDEVRLLATPSAADAIPRLMQAIGRRYVPYLNRRSGRVGALWERRYRSTLIDAGPWLLASMRHIEQRPVVAAGVAHAERWQWSSYAHHVGAGRQDFLSDHAGYWALSDTPFERQAAYRRFAEELADVASSEAIDAAVERGWILGDPAFVERLDGLASRRGRPLGRGRKPLPR